MLPTILKSVGLTNSVSQLSTQKFLYSITSLLILPASPSSPQSQTAYSCSLISEFPLLTLNHLLSQSLNSCFFHAVILKQLPEVIFDILGEQQVPEVETAGLRTGEFLLLGHLPRNIIYIIGYC